MPKEYFDKSFSSNSDGFGFAWVKDELTNYVKGMMKVEEAWKIYKAWIKEEAIFPHVVHFRCGKPTIPELTHPFEVSKLSPLSLATKTKNEVLFHNGGVTAWRDRMFEMFTLSKEIPEGPIIDTRVMAILYFHYGKRIFNFIDGKFVSIGPKSLNVFGEFKEDDGVRYSNDSYKPPKYNHTKDRGEWKYNQEMFNAYADIDSLDKAIDEFIV
jgi:hypothetical protein